MQCIRKNLMFEKKPKVKIINNFITSKKTLNAKVFKRNKDKV